MSIMETVIYINVAVTGEVDRILGNLLDRIKASGLGEHCKEIHLVINGDLSKLTVDLSDPIYVIHHSHRDSERYEFPAIDLLWKKAQEEDLRFLYLHTKGVGSFRPTVEDWVEYLIHFNVDRWRDRLEELGGHDCTGVNLQGEWNPISLNSSLWDKEPLYLKVNERLYSLRHYSGNFWWSKSSHLKKLPNPYRWIPDENFRKWRIANEMWVCQIQEGEYFGAWTSGVNHYDEYYPKEKYRSE